MSKLKLYLKKPSSFLKYTRITFQLDPSKPISGQDNQGVYPLFVRSLFALASLQCGETTNKKRINCL